MTRHILILADGRSPTTLSWIANLRRLNFTVSLISTYPCPRPENVYRFHVFTLALSRFTSRTKKPSTAAASSSPSLLKRIRQRLLPLMQHSRYYAGPISVWMRRKAYSKLIEQIQPDLVHALRIPFEGMLGSFTPPEVRFVVATWGNDLTLHAAGSSWMQRLTRRCLSRADGITSDTRRDIRLAHEHGLRPNVPALTVPGSGGINLSIIRRSDAWSAGRYAIPDSAPWVVNPRGIRPGSLNQQAFFAAIPQVLANDPNTIFICPGLKGVPQAEAWVRQYGIESQTYLIPKLSQPELWGLFKASQIFVSPSRHDGTPNTLLEALAAGCFPIVGDIESLREWITDGENGFLINPDNPGELAEAITTALHSPGLLEKSSINNFHLLKSRADIRVTLPLIEQFYEQVLNNA